MIAVHRVRPWEVLRRQLRSALLLLLVVTAALSFFVGDRTDAVIIGVILVASVGLGFVNEYRAELAAQALHTQIRHDVVVRRDGRSQTVDVTDLVPGDVVRLTIGSVVPADVRIVAADGLECDESVLTGESLPADKAVCPGRRQAPSSPTARRARSWGRSCSNGDGEGVVVATGRRTEFGRIAAGLGERQEETEFQAGLRHFSVLLVEVAGVLTTLDLRDQRALAAPAARIAAVLARDRGRDHPAAAARRRHDEPRDRVASARPPEGARQAARVHRGSRRHRDPAHRQDRHAHRGSHHASCVPSTSSGDRRSGGVPPRACSATRRPSKTAQVVGGNPLDVALWEAADAATVSLDGVRRLATVPFDHDRRMSSVLVDDPPAVGSSSPRARPNRSSRPAASVPDAARRDARHRVRRRRPRRRGRDSARRRSSRPSPPPTSTISRSSGYLVFLDQPKLDAAASLERLAELGITVKVVTGDNAIVAEKICRDLGLDVARPR